MKNGNKGFTIVEVMVSFVLLLIGIAGVFTCIRVTQNIVKASSEMRESEENAVEAYYKKALIVEKDDEGNEIAETITFTITTRDNRTPLEFSFKVAHGSPDGSTKKVYYFVPSTVGGNP